MEYIVLFYIVPRYGMACPMDKTCMIQQLEWPRTMRLPVCVAEKFIPAHMKACYQPPDAGPCGAEFIRWHFNVQANQCSWFYYSGCLGNRNNFFSRDACEKACLGDIVSKEDTSSGDVKNLPESAEVIRAREFLSRPPPKFQELRSPQIETVIKRRKDKSRNGSHKTRNGSHKTRTSRRRNRNRTHRVVYSADVDRYPNAYRKTMRRGELFKLFSTLNYRLRSNNGRAP